MMQALTPEQTAQILQVNVATIYQMIKKGDLFAKKVGEKQYRVSPLSLNWIWGNLDVDLKEMDAVDRQFLPVIQKSIKKVRLQQ